MNEKNFYNNLNKKNMSVKNNSSILPHQQNNYYYNTKINHLIFHEYLNTNQNHNDIQNGSFPYNSMCAKYDLLNSDLNEGKKIIQRNENNNSYYKNSISLKKSDKFKNMKIDLNETEINMKANISTTRNKNSENSYIKYVKNGNITTTNNDLFNKSNNFQAINQTKKKNSKNNIEKNISINDHSQNLKNDRIKSLKNLIPKCNIENNNNFIDLMSYKNINNNYFYNIQNNYEKSDNKIIKKGLLEKNNIFLNDYPSINSLKSIEMNYKKVSVKNDKDGNNHIKSPFSSINQKINYNNKMNKSPEIIRKQKSKNNTNKNIKPNKVNNNNENKKRDMNIYTNNEKNKLNNNENRNSKRNLINNINDKNKDKLNNNINHSINNNKGIHNNNKNKINYYYNQLNKIPNKSSIKKNNPSLNIKIRKFCDILEQLLYISFKNCFKIFIDKINAFNEYNISKRALIIKRFQCLNKNKKSNNHSHNNSFSQTSFSNSQNMKSNSLIKESSNNEFNNKRKKKKSPTKFIELQDNLKSSMMNINQDNYIQMFNELFMKQRENLMVKTCRSPMIERNNKDSSFDINNNDEKAVYDKYKLNTNSDMHPFYQKDKYLSRDLNNNLEGSFNKNNSYYYDIKNIENDNNGYKLSTQDNNFIGNIFDDDNINLIKYNYSIEPNLRRNNSITKIINNSDHINTNKNILLYSKPKLTKTKYKKENIPNNKTNIIYLKKNERDLNNNPINIFMSNSNKNIFSYPMSPTIKNKKTELSDKKNSENKKEFKKNEIIIKNVHTKDKKLYVFIKYVKLKNYNSSSFSSNKLFYSHTDSISLIRKYNNQNNIYHFENINSKSLNKNNEEKNQKEKFKYNSNSSEDDDTSIIFLINFLQNIFNDNKKTILYNFWRNLKKIKTNYILQNKIKTKKTINKSREQKIENNNIIELQNYRNNNNLIKNKLSITSSGNKDREKNANKPNIIKKINLNQNNINAIKYNKSCNNIFDKSNKKNEENSLENKDKSQDESLKNEQLKMIKLAKLGKLFKNLEKEKNIINTIKEQFLDWTNKQDENTKQEKINKENDKYILENLDNKNLFN